MREADRIRECMRALDSLDARAKLNARECLIAMGPVVVDRLIGAVHSETIHQTWEVASVLAEVDDPRCVQLMEEILTSRNPLLGSVAVRALQKRGKESVIRLLEALPQCKMLVQIGIVEALEKIGDPQAVGPLMELLRSTSAPTLRYTIIQALGMLGDPQAIELIRTFQDDPDQHVQKRAQIALERLESTLGGTPARWAS